MTNEGWRIRGDELGVRGCFELFCLAPFGLKVSEVNLEVKGIAGPAEGESSAFTSVTSTCAVKGGKRCERGEGGVVGSTPGGS